MKQKEPAKPSNKATEMDHYEKVPIPSLVRQGGEKRQQQGFLEPSKPTVSGSAGVFHCFLDFGTTVPSGSSNSLLKVYILPKDRRPAWETKPRDTNVFVRRDRGTVQYNIWRKDGDRYEDRKFNVLKYPIMGNKNNWEYGQGLSYEAMDELGRDILYMAQWPYCPCVKTNAPFIWRTEARHTMDASTLPEGLLKLFETPELFTMILEELVGGWEDLSNLSRTSQRMFLILGSHFARINVRASAHKSLVFIPPGFKEPLLVDAEAFTLLPVGPFLIAGGIREGWRKGAEPDENCDYTHPETQVWAYPDNVQYHSGGVRSGMQTYLELLHCIHLKPKFLQHVLFQGVMFLDVHGVRAIIRSCPKLQTIGIHNCEILHFGATKQLLRIIDEENNARSQQGSALVEFDFFPRYYQGPRRNSLGCYGVIWSDEGRLDTIKAVTAALLSIIPLARKAEVDLLRPGKAYRLWLDKLPFKLRTLPYILDVILRLDDLDQSSLHMSTAEFKRCPKKEAQRKTLWAELNILLSGQAMSQASLEKVFEPRDLTDRWLYRCCECETEMTANFFVGNGMLEREDDTRVCHGCQLMGYLNGEGHNYNSLHMKTRTAHDLWKGGEITSIHDLFSPKRYDDDSNDEYDKAEKPTQITQAQQAAIAIHRRRERIPAQIAKAERALDELRSPGHSRRYGGTRETSQVDQAETLIQYLKAELGISQIASGTEAQPGRPAAASWENNVRWYMSAVEMERGRIINYGPYAGVVTSEITAMRNGTGLW